MYSFHAFSVSNSGFERNEEKSNIVNTPFHRLFNFCRSSDQQVISVVKSEFELALLFITVLHTYRKRQRFGPTLTFLASGGTHSGKIKRGDVKNRLSYDPLPPTHPTPFESWQRYDSLPTISPPSPFAPSHRKYGSYKNMAIVLSITHLPRSRFLSEANLAAGRMGPER